MATPATRLNGAQITSSVACPVASGAGGLWWDGNTTGPKWRKADGTDVTLGAGGGGSTGNWTFSGDAADDVNAMTIAASTAPSLSLGRSGINILLPGGVIRASTAAANTAGVAFTFGLNNGGAAGTGSAAGAGGANTWTSGQGGAATTTAGETAAAGGGTVVQGGQGGTGAASTNGPAAGGTAIVRGGAAGTVTSGFSGANGGDCILRGGALSGTGTNGSVVLGDSNTAAIKLSNTVVNFATNGVWSALTQGATNTTGLTIKPNVADGASSVGFVIDCGTTLATGGARSLSIRNNGSEVMYLDPTVPTLRFASGSSGTIGNAAISLTFTGSNIQTHGGVAPDADNSYPLGGGGNRWLGIYNSGPVINGRNVQSGTTYTATATDYYISLTNTAARTVTLPAASGVTAGYTLVVKDAACTAGTGNVTISRAGTDTIVTSSTGATSVVINTNGGVVWLVSNGSNTWEKIN